MHVNKHCFIFSELWYLHLKEQQVPLRRFQTRFVGHNHVWPRHPDCSGTAISVAEDQKYRELLLDYTRVA